MLLSVCILFDKYFLLMRLNSSLRIFRYCMLETFQYDLENGRYQS